jgi:uncharacterized membrane protein YeaQ/YmgE (transglycosylase-associated protein family)
LALPQTILSAAVPPLGPLRQVAFGGRLLPNGTAGPVRSGRVTDEKGGNRMGFIAWIILGAIAGALGKLIMPGRDPGGIIVTILIGMAGAIVGGFIVQGLLGLGGGGFIWSILVATLGAIVLLAIYRLIVGQRRA